MIELLLGLHADKYHVEGWHGIHALLDYHDNGPLYFKMKHIDGDIQRDETAAFDVGTAAHTAILEGLQQYESTVCVRPSTYIDKKTGEAKLWHGGASYCKQWMASHAGKTIISEVDDYTIRGMCTAISQHNDAMALLGNGIPEVTLREKRDCGNGKDIGLQCRIDWISGNGLDPWQWDGLVDYKTTKSLASFERGGLVMAYMRQAAWYRSMVKERIGSHLPWYWIVQEKHKPYRVQVYYALESDLQLAQDMNEDLLERVQASVRDDSWPMGTGGVKLLKLPKYLTNNHGENDE